MRWVFDFSLGKSLWRTIGCSGVLAAAILANWTAPALAADAIAGVVHNRTAGGPAAGDDVLLLSLDRGTPEEARTRTDAQGTFTLKGAHPDRSYLVRVIHQNVIYDQQASPGNALSVDVFDAAAKVQGLSGSIEVIRIGTVGDHLHVSDMIEIENGSKPPLTQAGERTFEVYLPAHAKLSSLLAADSKDIALMISAVPVPGEPGHYTVNFPLRPGATRFAFNYDLPYDGHVTFHPKSIYPLQQLAVMFPLAMTFTSPSRSHAFQILPVGNVGYRVEAVNQVNAGEGPEFEISGMGAFPSIQPQTQAQTHVLPKPPDSALTASALLPRGEARQNRGEIASVTMPVSVSSTRSSPLQWWYLGAGATLMLGIFGLIVRRQRRPAYAIAMAAQTTAEHAPQMQTLLMEALKQEIFQLEVDRLQGTITAGEYASAKQTLKGTIDLAVARAGRHRETIPL
jgi:hypothetical protein